MIPTLETERLLLRGIKPDDYEPFAAFSATDAARFVGGAKDGPAAWRSLATIAGSWTLCGYGEFAVEEKGSGRFIGVVGPWFPEGWPEQEIGWIIFPEFQGKGYASEAAARTLAFAYHDLGWTTAISCIDNENLPSQRVAEKLGARRDGEAEFKPYGMMPVYRHLPPSEFFARHAQEPA
ncbi:GNAT family N-acetyltransferase [Aliihoeflea aestuarii]|jgi:RimJ/RimL family protein N-acetyltransferase|uniref:GNAT family N-acetyltransferase n=1 Tax=Aliihoeflea aestuarii TaxID=453840 RepID=UPI0020935246|nr:GNAT family N-acetyltransferase [Aliihoeflea aestuarii]MCO6391075.1 GNAT family N-acetyltransferase [Aliihoeflea aestuarii]